MKLIICDTSIIDDNLTKILNFETDTGYNLDEIIHFFINNQIIICKR
jgi:2-oxoglutarate dehydrogenase complex dehydrogenase (E1) component-like enzyme